MKKILLMMVLGVLAITGCKKDDNGDDGASKTLNITLKTEESYRFNENTISVITAPKNFVATINNNEVKGEHEGETTMEVKAGNITYNCKIKVKAANTYYVDMAIHLGQSMDNIIKIYGEPIKTVDNSSLFGPLTSLSSEINNIFAFDANNKVVSCMIYFPLSSGMSIVSHLQDRYVVYVSKNYTALMGDSNNLEECKNVVFYDFSDSPVSVMYTTKAYLDQQSNRTKSTPYDLDVLSKQMRALFL